MIVFVLGSGGVRGASQVGMLRALSEGGIRPDLLLGTSIGAINAAMFAQAPHASGLNALEERWCRAGERGLIPRYRTWRRSGTTVLSSRGTHVFAIARMEEYLRIHLSAQFFADLALPLEVGAASVRSALPIWMRQGPLVPAILASAAAPGLFPPVAIDEDLLIDGGVLDAVPLGHALDLQATVVYVLDGSTGIQRRPDHLSNPLDIVRRAHSIASRSRYAEALARAAQEGVLVHVLPTGAVTEPPRGQQRPTVVERMSRAYRATADYISAVGGDHG